MLANDVENDHLLVYLPGMGMERTLIHCGMGIRHGNEEKEIKIHEGFRWFSLNC